MATYHVETDNGSYEVETEEPKQPGMMDIFPKMLREAADIGAPNAAQQLVGSAVGEQTSDPNVNPMKDTKGLEDTTLNDASMATAVAAPMLEGAGKFAVPQLERLGRNQTMKGLGGSMSQIRQMATKGDMDAAAKFANEKGLNDFFSTSLGRENLLKKLESDAGSKLGALRDQAGTALNLNPAELKEKVMGDPRMAKYLGEGLQSGEASDIPKALADVSRIGGEAPSHADLAKAATELNQSAAGSKLYQPTNATTDVANILSRENNAGIASSLGPEKAAEYDAARNDYSQIEPLKHLQERGELREMAGRSHGGMFQSVKQGASDLVGYRGMAKTAYGIGGMTTHLMSLLSTNPAQLGKYAAPLLKAAQTGGNDGLAATHFILSQQHPEYNAMLQSKQESQEDQ